MFWNSIPFTGITPVSFIFWTSNTWRAPLKLASNRCHVIDIIIIEAFLSASKRALQRREGGCFWMQMTQMATVTINVQRCVSRLWRAPNIIRDHQVAHLHYINIYFRPGTLQQLSTSTFDNDKLDSSSVRRFRRPRVDFNHSINTCLPYFE